MKSYVEKMNPIGNVGILLLLVAFARADDWSHPAYANDNGYVRSDNELTCISLK